MTTALLRAAWHAGGMIAAAVERGWLARCSSAENGYPHLFGRVVSMHIATTYQPQFTARDVLVVVTREKDFTAGESANSVEAVVQKVSMYYRGRCSVSKACVPLYLLPTLAVHAAGVSTDWSKGLYVGGRLSCNHCL